MKCAPFLLYSGTEMLQRFWTNWLPFSGHRSTAYLPMLSLGRQRSLYSYSSALYSQVGCCSFTKSCPTLCDFMNYSTPGFPILHCLPQFASLLAQLVKNLPAVQKTWIRSLGWKDSLEKGMATHSSSRAWKIPWTEKPAGYSPWGHKEPDTNEQLTLTDRK